MIPSLHIVAWGRAVPWVEPRQVEQDLIISRAVVALFDDPFLRRELRFRGGTAHWCSDNGVKDEEPRG